MKRKQSKCPQCGKTIDDVKNQSWESWNYCCRSYFDIGMLKPAQQQTQQKVNEKIRKGDSPKDNGD